MMTTAIKAAIKSVLDGRCTAFVTAKLFDETHRSQLHSEAMRLRPHQTQPGEWLERLDFYLLESAQKRIELYEIGMRVFGNVRTASWGGPSAQRRKLVCTTSLNDVILGIVEGLTEFLPVSSTAHLLIVQDLLGFTPPGDVFPIVIQFGAILSVVAVYWRRFWDVLLTLAVARGLAKVRTRRGRGVPARGRVWRRTARLYQERSLCAGRSRRRSLRRRSSLAASSSWSSSASRRRRATWTATSCRFRQAFWIGMFQVLAIIPGVSRSGATILGGELIGVDRKAARSVHLLSRGADHVRRDGIRSVEKSRDCSISTLAADIAVGFVVSFLVALVVVRTFIGFIGRYGLKPFGWYRIAAGLGIIAVLAASMTLVAHHLVILTLGPEAPQIGRDLRFDRSRRDAERRPACSRPVTILSVFSNVT